MRQPPSSLTSRDDSALTGGMGDSRGPKAPAGWYPDEAWPGQLRYWDGTAWSAHRKFAEPPQGRLRKKWLVNALVGLVTLALAAVVLFVMTRGSASGVSKEDAFAACAKAQHFPVVPGSMVASKDGAPDPDGWWVGGSVTDNNANDFYYGVDISFDCYVNGDGEVVDRDGQPLR